MRIYDILKELENTSSMNKKIEILKENKDNELLKKVFYYTYNKMYNYHIKKIPNVKNHLNEITIEDEIVWQVLDDLRNRKVTGNEARGLVRMTLMRMNKEDAELFAKIIKKDLKIGVNVKSINKVWNNLIPEIPYMGCRPYNEKDFNELLNSTDKVYCEIKYDGEFVNIISNNGIKTLSRSGKDIYLEHLFKNIPDGYVLTGELLIKGMDRYTSNGIINSLKQLNEKIKTGIVKDKDINDFIKKYGKTPQEIEKDIYVVVWDVIPNESWIEGFWDKPLKERRELLKDFIKDNIQMVEYIEVNTEDRDKIFKYYIEKLQDGEEGIIVKDVNGFWKNGRHKIAQKFKLVMDLDLKIVGYKYGNTGTKYSDKVNRLVLESEDGILKTTTSGVDEKTMDFLTENKDKLIGKIATITCSGLSQNSDGSWSVLHPRFKELREDKDIANTFNECKEIEESAKSLNKRK